MKDIIARYLKRTGFERFEPKVALFDMDGVLYDSMKNHAKAWHESMAQFGIEMSEKEAYLYEGMRGVETIRLMTKKTPQAPRRGGMSCLYPHPQAPRGGMYRQDISDKEAQDMYRVKSEYYSASPKAELIPGVHSLQEMMKSRGMRIGVVTGSGQATLLQRILKDFEGLVSPDIIVTALDIEYGKPAPDPYIKGMRKAGAEPWQTIVIENAPLGVRAGVAAGCMTIAVNTGPLPDEALACEGADVVLHNMEEVKKLFEI